MNKVVTVNLGGNAFQLEEGAFESLRTYLDRARQNLAANPDRDEIVADIERAIADKFRLTLTPHKTVVLGPEVDRIVAEMGPVEGGAENAAASGPATPPPPPASGPAPGPKRLYLIREGSMLGGVCTGVAAYCHIDVSVVRILFVCVALCAGIGVHFPWGCLFWVIAYLVLMLVIPTATTPEERAAATGMPFDTAQDFIRRAKEGYYEGMKKLRTAHSRHERREQRREMRRQWRDEHRREVWQDWHAHPYHPYRKHFLLSLAESLVSVAVIVIVVIVADHHSSHVHRILMEIPGDLRHAADSVKDWWRRR